MELPGLERLATPDQLMARVMRDAKRQMVGVAPDALERYVQSAVGSLCTERTRVTTFIPVLALRDVRAMVERDGMARP